MGRNSIRLAPLYPEANNNNNNIEKSQLKDPLHRGYLSLSLFQALLRERDRTNESLCVSMREQRRKYSCQKKISKKDSNA